MLYQTAVGALTVVLRGKSEPLKTTNERRNVGMGLRTVMDLVKKRGGRLAVESEL